MPGEPHRLGRGHEQRPDAAAPQRVQEQVDVPHADRRPNGSPERLPVLQLGPDVAQQARPHVAQQVLQVVLHHAPRRRDGRRGGHGEARAGVGVPAPHQREGQHLRAGEAVPQPPRQQDADGVLAIPVGGHGQPRAQRLRQRVQKPGRLVQHGGHAGDQEGQGGPPAVRKVVQVLLGAGQGLRAEVRGRAAQGVQFARPVTVVIPKAALAHRQEPRVRQGPPEALRAPDGGEGQHAKPRSRRGAAGRTRRVRRPDLPAIHLDAGGEDALQGDEAPHRLPQLRERLRRRLVRLGDHHQVRSGEGADGLPQDARWDQPAAAEGAGGVDQDDVRVPPQGAMLKGVVRDRQLHPRLPKRADAQRAPTGHRHGDLRKAAGEQERLVADGVATALPAEDHHGTSGPPARIAAAHDARPNAPLRHGAGQHLHEGGLVRAPIGEVPHADEGDGGLLRAPQAVPVQEVDAGHGPPDNPFGRVQETPWRRAALAPHPGHVALDDAVHGRSAPSAPPAAPRSLRGPSGSAPREGNCRR